jgi:hypothetical protein
MIVRTGLPTYHLDNEFTYRPGDVLGRKKFGNIIEHRFLVGFDGAIAHSPGPGQVFQIGNIQDVLTDGGLLHVIDPSPSLEETDRRFARADALMGMAWWNMNCHMTVNFIVAPDDFWATLRAA